MKQRNQSLFYAKFNSPLGLLKACASETGITALDFFDEGQDEVKVKNEVSRNLEQLEEELSNYFAGTLKEFTVPLDPSGTDFQKRVWEELRKIPFGETISYKDQSLRMNNPDGIRAIASANGSNPIAILVPCHRVIGSDGSLTGYAGGLHRKKWLLDFERKIVGKPVQITLNLFP